MNELVSLIVPIYNVERYLGKCLDSLIKQTYENIEILLINDGSTDSSLRIANEFQRNDNRIKIIDKANEGLSIARQTGIDLCAGIFFSTIDSDDYLDQHFVERMVDSLIENNGDVALCAKVVFDENGYREDVLLEKDTEPVLVASEKLLESEYAKICGVYQMSDSWNKMYRTDFVRSTCVKFKLQREYNGTDLLFNHMLLMNQPVIVTVNESLYNYRLTQNSRVRRKDKHLERGFRIIYDYLVEESKITIDTEKMREQIGCVYLGMLKYATLDVYEEHKNEGKARIIGAFKEIVASMPSFSKRKRRALLRSSQKYLRLFSYLLLSHNYVGMYYYYKLREVIR